MLRWSLQRLLEEKYDLFYARKKINSLHAMQFKIEIMSLGNFRSFKVYKGKNSALLGGMRCSLALSLHMIHINGFGVKKQPPIALLSNICLVVLVKTVPLLAASM